MDQEAPIDSSLMLSEKFTPAALPEVCAPRRSLIGRFDDAAAGKAALDNLKADAKPAAPATAAANEGVYALLDFSDETEREFAERGLIAAPDTLEITGEDGKVVWSQKAYAFLDGADAPADAPDTANPSLWRNAQINHLFGLFEVVDGIYQVRGYDMTNITFVRGDTGWIVFDPLMSCECSRAAFQLVTDNLGERPVMGIVMSHPHVDHYGGIKGIVSEEEVAERSIPIIVPQGFAEHAVAENVYAGNPWGAARATSTARSWKPRPPASCPSASAWGSPRAPSPTSRRTISSRRRARRAPSTA